MDAIFVLKNLIFKNFIYKNKSNFSSEMTYAFF